MAMTRRRFINACLGLGVVAVAGRYVTRADTINEQWYLFGTLVDVTLTGGDRATAQTALGELAAELQLRNTHWHPWGPGQMQDINRAIARNESIAIDAAMAHMIRQSQALHLASEKTFNPAIGRLVARWGFHGGQHNEWQVPDSDSIAELVAAAPSPIDLSINDASLSSSNPQVQLDFGGYAKGYAIDLGRQVLATNGVTNALINAGGDLVTLGHSPQGDAWRVAIRHPQRGGALAWLDVDDGEAVFTSGNYERYREHAGHRYPHIIDPRSGVPVRGVASATVVHSDASTADAAATALVVAGPRNWRRVAESMGIEQAMVVDEQGEIYSTPGLKRRLRLPA